MKIEKLTEDKLKITLTLDDLADRNIDLYSFMYNSPESQDLFWDAMNKAEEECGFNVDNSMIYVEASTSGGGNFTLIVTKTKEKPVVKFDLPESTSSKKGKIVLKRRTSEITAENNIFEFSSFDDICNYCKNINMSQVGKNTIYNFDNKYYLKASSLPPTMTILEYATLVKRPELFEAKLNEYGRAIISNNALQTVSKFFNKRKKRIK